MKATIVCCLLALILAGCASNTNTATNSNRAASNSTAANATNSVEHGAGDVIEPVTGVSDSDFLKGMAIGGASQVELGKVASTKATDPEVKKFAELMVAEHSKSNGELKAIASMMQVVLPEGGPRRNYVMDDLRKLSGSDFDKEYIQIMVEVHTATVADFEGKAKDAADPDLKAFVVKTLPTLRMHLQEVTAMQAKMK